MKNDDINRKAVVAGGLAIALVGGAAIAESYRVSIFAKSVVSENALPPAEQPGDPQVWIDYGQSVGARFDGNEFDELLWNNGTYFTDLQCLPSVSTPCNGYAGNFPESHISGSIKLARNSFRNVDGLISLQTVGGKIDLSDNLSEGVLNNIDGLSNLREAGHLDFMHQPISSAQGLRSLERLTGAGTNGGTGLVLSYTNLSNLDGLENLTSIGGNLSLNSMGGINIDALSNLTYVGGTISTYMTRINSIVPLKDVQVGGIVAIDKSYSGPTLPASSTFCQNSFSTRDDIYETKATLCQ